MDKIDAEIGRTLARLRGDMSQADLATKMRQRDWRWSQATVSSVETGERPLRLAEATEIAKILGLRVDSLVGGDPTSELIHQSRETVKALVNLERAAQAFVEAKHTTMQIASEMERNHGGVPKDQIKNLQILLSTTAEYIAMGGKNRALGQYDGSPHGASQWDRLFFESEGYPYNGEHSEEA